MPDKNYSVDDILRELRQKQASAPRETARPKGQKPRSAPARQDWPEDEEEDVVEYQPSRPKASRREEPERKPQPKIGRASCRERVC